MKSVAKMIPEPVVAIPVKATKAVKTTVTSTFSQRNVLIAALAIFFFWFLTSFACKKPKDDSKHAKADSNDKIIDDGKHKFVEPSSLKKAPKTPKSFTKSDPVESNEVKMTKGETLKSECKKKSKELGESCSETASSISKKVFNPIDSLEGYTNSNIESCSTLDF